ncbi:MAG: hypothetical protein KF912_13755 [Phycisphaeraceae bacterium]|nr:hypothetical protein [Phycisphaeraceae bacterium]MBX3368372.1 hypothetical protein [Phycisphaeraceae bacterium]
MTLDEIRGFKNHAPFHPFEIVLVDGHVFKVPHPDFIFVPPGRGTWIYVADPKGHVEHINTVVISSVRLAKPSSRRKKAG